MHTSQNLPHHRKRQWGTNLVDFILLRETNSERHEFMIIISPCCKCLCEYKELTYLINMIRWAVESIFIAEDKEICVNHEQQQINIMHESLKEWKPTFSQYILLLDVSSNNFALQRMMTPIKKQGEFMLP